ncbi:MAG: dihydropteroate synthase [Acidobacteriaceae bacterium]|nr:dihydropteroate synthase [Acidobacteriaceae bacterium]MBV9500637.1 dihydropteroate synthase [Acidobacteriaceae bacterium]
MPRRYQWKLKERELALGERTLLMGVLNVTPDSFSDGGLYSDPDRAFARAMELEDQGADILDVGAESTRPGSKRIPESEELRRLIPVLKRLRGKLAIPISVDTYKSGVAEKALEHGAEIINDPTGLLLDLQIAKVVVKHDAGLIVNHMRGTPETWAKLPPLKDLMRSIAIDIEAALHRARQAGVQKHQVVIDPGLGFGKRREQNSEIIANLGMLRSFDVPIVIGPSRKSFLKKEQEVLTEFATAAAVGACILNGAQIVRVHDVKAMKSAVEVADLIRQSAPDEETRVQSQARRRSQ